MNTVSPPSVREDAEENVRMADEAARDVWQVVMALLAYGPGKHHRGVQHTNGRILVTVEVKA